MIVVDTRKTNLPQNDINKTDNKVQYFTFLPVAPDGLANPSASGLDWQIQAERKNARIVIY
jgi:hypothetical protein